MVTVERTMQVTCQLYTTLWQYVPGRCPDWVCRRCCPRHRLRHGVGAARCRGPRRWQWSAPGRLPRPAVGRPGLGCRHLAATAGCARPTTSLRSVTTNRTVMRNYIHCCELKVINLVMKFLSLFLFHSNFWVPPPEIEPVKIWLWGESDSDELLHYLASLL